MLQVGVDKLASARLCCTRTTTVQVVPQHQQEGLGVIIDFSTAGLSVADVILDPERVPGTVHGMPEALRGGGRQEAK